MPDSFRIVRKRETNALLLRLYILDQRIPVATAYLRFTEDGQRIKSREINWNSIGYVDIYTTVALVEGIAELILQAEAEGEEKESEHRSEGRKRHQDEE